MILDGLTKFETNFKLNQRIGVLLMEWDRSYPNIDVRSQIQWAHCWLLENPKKDKKDYVRFLGNWMRTAQARAVERKTNVVVHKPYVEAKPAQDDVMTGEDFKKMREAIRK
jgi:hypothetical protein